MPEFEYEADTVLVTGALGSVGRWVVDRLADTGTHVVGVDLEHPDGTRPNAEFWTVDLSDHGLTRETIDQVGADAVVHLAAVADPVSNPDSRVFDNNVTSTYNVLTAAGRSGIDIVWTSSQAAYGTLFGQSAWTPAYLPIDEAHDCRPEDVYGLSKICGEEIAKTVARRDGISVTTIRPATIFGPHRTKRRPHGDDTDLSTDVTDGNFGSYVDVRDVARMVEAALASDHDGHETVLCVADENYLGQPTTEIVEASCGTLPDDCDLEGKQAALSNAKAADLLGWRPEYSTVDQHADAAEPDWV
ncbi:NAD-dependent epimerase/dehydratase family protein [Halovenus marina]|uniref:NAD-dependent epimerase/dehydratase family protein n=1 Tax=Halovenus marina TaxID=3396621 RepID=UPI003F549AC4